jgi:hypothetical protein
MRGGSNMADIQVNLLHKEDRDLQSHDIAKAMRPEIQKIAKKYGANVKLIEVPPGPPVLSTLVAEIYGPDYEEQIKASFLPHHKRYFFQILFLINLLAYNFIHVLT